MEGESEISIFNDLLILYAFVQAGRNFDQSEFFRVKSLLGVKNCGACWAFGAVEAMSDRICIASAGKVKVNISSQDLVACGNLGGCDGGDPAEAWQYWVDNGLVTGDLYGAGGCLPYSIKPGHHGEPYLPTPECNPTCQSSYPKTYT